MSPAHVFDRAGGVMDTGAVTAFTGCKHPSNVSRRPGGYYGRARKASRAAGFSTPRLRARPVPDKWSESGTRSGIPHRKRRASGTGWTRSTLRDVVRWIPGRIPLALHVPGKAVRLILQPTLYRAGGTTRDTESGLRSKLSGGFGTTKQKEPARWSACRSRSHTRGVNQAGWLPDSNRKPSRLGIVTAVPQAGFDRRQGRSPRARIASEGRRRRIVPSSRISSMARNP